MEHPSRPQGPNSPPVPSDTSFPAGSPPPLPFLVGALEATEDGLLVIDTGGSVRYYNRRLTEILSVPGELFERLDAEDAAEQVQEVFRDPDRFLEMIEREWRRPEIVSREELRLRDGRIIHRFSRPLRVGGEITGRVISVRDVTELREARRERNRAERRYRTLFEMSPLALVVSRPGGEMVSVNRRFERLLGWTHEEVAGRDVQGLKIWVSLQDRADVLARLEADEAVRDYATVLRTADGEAVEAELSVEVLELDGEPFLVWAIRDVSERNRYRREIERKALYDDLTDLPNRTLLHDRLAHALEAGQRDEDPLAVLFVDLDDFKAVNDSYGHAAGDRVLSEAAARMSDVLRESETLARLGGDEFVAVLEGADEEGARRVTRRLLQALEEAPFEVPGGEIEMTAHAGIARESEDLREPDALIRAADAAMTRSRTSEVSGEARYRVYGPEDEGQVYRLQRRERLRKALQEGEFVLHYQPVVDLQEEERIVGAEALIRWDHPEQGLVGPGDFIPFAEEAGLIAEIDHWVLREAAGQAVEWSGGPHSSDSSLSFHVAVNVSAPSYQSPGFADQVASVLEETELSPTALQLEITERLSVSGGGWSRLRRAGVRLAVDDFGSGYSSLRYLKQLEADVLKVDQYFIQDLSDEADRTSIILRAVLTVGRQMGLQLVAEGVETEAQRSHLVGLGYRYAQGYLFARPMPVEELARSLEAQAG